MCVIFQCPSMSRIFPKQGPYTCKYICNILDSTGNDETCAKFEQYPLSNSGDNINAKSNLNIYRGTDVDVDTDARVTAIAQTIQSRIVQLK